MSTKGLIVLIIVIASPLSVFSHKSSLSFIENVGQIKDQFNIVRKDIDFVIQGTSMSIFIGKGKLIYQFYNRNNTHRVEAILKGSSSNALAFEKSDLPYYENHYFNGSERRIAHTYDRIVYKNIYPHIDWVLKINKDNTFEYEFSVGVLGDASKIQLEYKGAESIKINNNGELIVKTSLGIIKEHAPTTYTKSGKLLQSNYVLHHNRLSFTTENYEGALVIDPKISWATYYGDTSDLTGLVNTDLSSVDCDQRQYIYAAGTTVASKNIATSGAYQSSKISALTKSNIFYVKFDTSGNRIYATYYGDGCMGARISVSKNYVFLCGSDSTGNLATPGVQQTGFTPFKFAPFITKFDASGALIWSSYCGGSNTVYSPYVQCDTLDNVFLSGSTNNTTLIATSGTYRDTYADSIDGYIVKYNSLGKRVWGTYLGGRSSDVITGLTFVSNDGQGAIYAYGITASDTGIATPGAFKTARTGSDDAMLIKFDTSGKRLWGSYFGGNQNELPSDIIQDRNKNIYLLGSTFSTSGIATAGAYQTANKGNYDAYIAKVSSTGSLLWSTYFGGEKQDINVQGAVDSLGNIFIFGTTQSLTSIADTAAFQPKHNGGIFDCFFAGLKPDGTRLWNSYYGGEFSDRSFGLVSDGANLYAVGQTSSAKNIATKGSFLDSNTNKAQHGFLVKIADAKTGYVTKPSVIRDKSTDRSLMKVFPNPVESQLNLELLSLGKGAEIITIVDIYGKIVFSKDFAQNLTGINRQSIDASGLSSGTYIVSYSIENKVQTETFIKK